MQSQDKRWWKFNQAKWTSEKREDEEWTKRKGVQNEIITTYRHIYREYDQTKKENMNTSPMWEIDEMRTLNLYCIDG